MSNMADHRFTLFLSIRAGLVSYAQRMVGTREAAEDIVQEAYIRFVPGASGRAVEESPKAYLYRVVHNLSIDLLRRERLEARRLQAAPFWAQPQPENSPEETILFYEGIRRAMDSLNHLPERQRMAFEMTKFGGYSVNEVASHLGVSVPTAYRLIQSAIATITAHLNNPPDDPPPQ